MSLTHAKIHACAYAWLEVKGISLTKREGLNVTLRQVFSSFCVVLGLSLYLCWLKDGKCISVFWKGRLNLVIAWTEIGYTPMEQGDAVHGHLIKTQTRGSPCSCNVAFSYLQLAMLFVGQQKYIGHSLNILDGFHYEVWLEITKKKLILVSK